MGTVLMVTGGVIAGRGEALRGSRARRTRYIGGVYDGDSNAAAIWTTRVAPRRPHEVFLMALLRARWQWVGLMAAATACAGAQKQPTSEQEPAARSTPAETPKGHAGPPCVVQAATTQLCFESKEEACAAMGCRADGCSYLYGGSSAPQVACDG